MSEAFKAPWEYERDQTFDGKPLPNYIVTADDGSDEPFIVAGVPQGGRFARLIAAAPDLLEALRECLGAMTGGMDGKWSPDVDAASMARAALSKALGGE